ncbi:MAG: hypothetical protein GTN93_21445 [Anaerolineae bacterium]|nr:hypothetical protein [Anaerolineae bacterium]
MDPEDVIDAADQLMQANMYGYYVKKHKPKDIPANQTDFNNVGMPAEEAIAKVQEEAKWAAEQEKAKIEAEKKYKAEQAAKADAILKAVKKEYANPGPVKILSKPMTLLPKKEINENDPMADLVEEMEKYVYKESKKKINIDEGATSENLHLLMVQIESLNETVEHLEKVVKEQGLQIKILRHKLGLEKKPKRSRKKKGWGRNILV